MVKNPLGGSNGGQKKRKFGETGPKFVLVVVFLVFFLKSAAGARMFVLAVEGNVEVRRSA